ncbi:hypothetical protein C0J45_5662 [Silurus meridionalis]|nr:hypothetical protein C0J45_5662 [Silurus meridionalis]
MTKEKGKSVYISCEVTGLSTDYVHWYQKKEDEAFKRILYAKKNSKPVPETNHPDAKDFDVLTQNNNYDLKITNVKKRHSGVYYCASWDSTTVTVIIHSVYKNPDGLQFYTSITARPGALKSAKIRVYYKQITMFLAIYAVLFSLVTEAVLGVILEQKDLFITKEEGKSMYISCTVKQLSTTYVHWYQKKEGEALRRILYVSDGSKPVHDTSHPEAKDFDKYKTRKKIVEFIVYFLIEAVLGVKLEQRYLSVTKAVGKTVHVNCKVSELSTTYVHWYQKKEGEALTRILYVKAGSKPEHDTNHPEAKDFSVRIESNNFDLKIENLKKIHSAVYYCASWEYNDHSGSKYSQCVQKL